MVSKCEKLIVIKLPGWETSTGVTAEIAHAKELGLLIEEIFPSEQTMEKATMLTQSAGAGTA